VTETQRASLRGQFHLRLSESSATEPIESLIEKISIFPMAMNGMKRVVILGRGAAGKSTMSRRLGRITGLPVVELDKIFWQSGLAATPQDEWRRVQEELVRSDRWIMDGDLGPYDAVDIRLQAADTVILLDFSLVRCAWRAIRRGRERSDFWRWVIEYRRLSRPALMQAIASYAPEATVHVLRSPGAARRFLAKAAGDAHPP
jgi:adenylate kinase family enzyme